MPNYLLSLTETHSAGPGSLDVIFGPDGDFEGAPRWTGPVWYNGFWVHLPPNLPAEHLLGFLDCRTPSVEARLLELCSEVIWPGQIITGARASLYQHGQWINLTIPHAGIKTSWFTSGQWLGGDWLTPVDVRDALSSEPPEGQIFTPASLLARVTLSLAPQIAKLKARVTCD